MKKKIIIISILLIIVVGIIIGVFARKKKNNKDIINYDELKQNSEMYNESATLEDLKKEYGATGDENLYDIETEYDGRKVLAIKASENFKVAFAGLVENRKITLDEATKIFDDEYPTNNGIWVEEKSREKILNYLNNNLNSKYEIDKNGYLTISSKKNSDYDNKIEKIINSNKQYIIGINSKKYYIDAISGEILDNPFEEFDKYQTYAYCQDDDKIVICITENTSKKLSNKEIFDSVVSLME
ncbi:MAG: hypothetical protein BHV99_06275 [Clostridium sp. 26_21]|nr:MAG: hypothetical protein BHV99_06275 [Clostridium sp. 26_21]